MKQFLDAIENLFGAISNWSSFLFAVAGLGTVTMAALQAIKEITPAPRLFQRYRMQQFLRAHANLAKANLGINADPNEAEAQIILLATDGDRDAFYNLDIEKLCGEWNAAIQIIIDSPEMCPDFLACVAARCRKQDFKKLATQDFPESLPPNIEVALNETEQKSRLHKKQAFMDARGRVRHQIQRAVDSFQISCSFRWKWLLQTASYIIAIILTVVAIFLDKGQSPITFKALVWSGVAGFLAPVARDLLAAVQKLRDPS